MRGSYQIIFPHEKFHKITRSQEQEEAEINLQPITQHNEKAQVRL